MFQGVTAAIAAFCEAMKSGFEFAQTSKEHQAETEVIKGANHSERAVDAAERALLVADRYQSVMTLKDRLSYLRWCRIFRKYN